MARVYDISQSNIGIIVMSSSNAKYFYFDHFVYITSPPALEAILKQRTIISIAINIYQPISIGQ